MSIMLVEAGKTDYEIIVTKVSYAPNYGILRVDGHYINLLRTPKKVLEMIKKKRINRVGLYSKDILELGKMNKIKNKPMVMSQYFKDYPSAQKFLRHCNVTLQLEQKDIEVKDERARIAKEIRWVGERPGPSISSGSPELVGVGTKSEKPDVDGSKTS